MTSRGGPRPITEAVTCVPGRSMRKVSTPRRKGPGPLAFRTPERLLEGDLAGAVEAEVLEIRDHVPGVPLYEGPDRPDPSGAEAGEEGVPQGPPAPDDDPDAPATLLGDEAAAGVPLPEDPGDILLQGPRPLSRQSLLDASDRPQVLPPHGPDAHGLS